MPLVSTAEIVVVARRSTRGVGAFNVIGVEHCEAVVAAAEKAGLPVVLQISENCVAYHGSLRPIAAAALACAAAAAVPVSVHLDHAVTVDLVHEAVELGLSSVMFDASTMTYSANVERTRAVVDFCHHHGVWVEGELGEVGGKDGVHAPHVRTDPAQAASYAQSTGVDALAVAVGTSHAMVTREAVLDFELIGQLRAAVPVPLVLHGSSGVPDDDLMRAVEAGITKINIATALNAAFTAAVRDSLAGNPAVVDTRTYLAAGRQAATAEAARLLRVLQPV